jgi:hypothetical protein
MMSVVGRRFQQPLSILKIEPLDRRISNPGTEERQLQSRQAVERLLVVG